MLALAATGLAAAPAAHAVLGDPGQATVDKRVNGEDSVSDLQPGASIAYTIRLGCNDNACIDLAMHDALPPQFAGFPIASLTASPSDFTTVTLTGCAVGSAVTASCAVDAVVAKALGTFQGEDVVGLPAGQSVLVQVVLTVPTTLTPDWGHQGEAVVNTATVTSRNAGSPSGSATASVTVPVQVAASTTKKWTPANQQFDPGETSTIATSVGNTSNVAADTLVLQDPSVALDGATSLAADNPYNKVDLTGLCASTLPEGATQVQVDAYYLTGGVWQWVTGTPAATAALPSAVTDPGLVGGLRYTYTGDGTSLVAGGGVGQQCQTVAQRATDRTTGASLVNGWTATNTTQATVTVPNQPSQSANATATLTVGGLTVGVQAGKQLTPQRINAGDSFTAALSAKNTSNGPLDSLTITEPGSGSDPDWFGTGLLLDAVNPSATWPTGADQGTLTFAGCTPHADPVQIDQDTGSVTPPTGCTPTGFAVVYTGSIGAGTSAGVDVTGHTSDTLIPPGTMSTPFPDVVDVSGTNAAGTATDQASQTLQVYYPTIAVSLDKSTRPGTVTPGGTVLTELTATTGRTGAPSVNPTEIDVQDVWDGTRGAFWDGFDATGVSFTAVPAGATLQVWVDTGSPSSPAWAQVTVPSGSPVSLDLPADVIGLRFVFTDPAGFAQGTAVQPNVVFTARGALRSDSATPTSPDDGTVVQYQNTATTTATGGHQPGTTDPLTATDTESASAGIVRYPAGGSGVLTKRWVTSSWVNDLNQVSSQSGTTAYTAVSWGVTTPGTTTLRLTDSPSTDPAGTVYDAFNLTGIRSISFTTDPLLQWDQVTTVELYEGTGWVTVTPPGGSWMSAAGFQGYTLSASEQASTTSVRVTVTENTEARNASQVPGRPAPNSGVAWSATGRPFGFVWQLRNVARSDGTWVTAQRAFNGGTGVVRNDVEQDTTGSGGPQKATASDTVALVDQKANLSATKTASPGTLTVPVHGQAAPADYPTETFTLGARNTSTARASYLRVADPCDQTCVSDPTNTSSDVFTDRTYDPASNPFEAFTLTGISFTVPSGVPIDESVSPVTLWHRAVDGGLSVTSTTMAQARTLSAADLADVVGVAVTYRSTDPAVTGGLIASGNTLTMTLTTQLRDTVRSTRQAMSTAALGTSTVPNTIAAQGFDPVLDPDGQPYANPHAVVALQDAALKVETAKSFSQSALLEENRNGPVTATLTADQAASTASPTQVVLTDQDAGFFADFGLTGLGTVTLPAGADQVRVDLLVGTTWHDGTAGTTATLPGDVTDLSTVVGIRFVFDRTDGLTFSGTVPPANWQAVAAFTAVLRSSVVFPTTVTPVVDTVGTTASNSSLPDATASADATIRLDPGIPQLDVRKDTQDGVHQVEPGVSVPWVLQFTNHGDGYLDVVTVTDELGPSLRWDDTTPTYATSVDGILPTTGVTVSQPDTQTLLLTFPTGSRLAPGETYTVTLGLVLKPGLTGAQSATNTFTVDAPTDHTFDSTTCVNTSNSRGVVLPASNRCGTTNVVTPVTGALLYVDKSVRGSLASATNLQDPTLPCTSDDGFYQGVCVANTVVGGRDTWRIDAVNTGTEPYSKLVVVDPLPVVGDRLLATGAARGSDFRPVLDGATGLNVQVPANVSWGWEVTTDAAVCVGTGSTSAWNNDPTCQDNNWSNGATYQGEWSAVTGIRVTITPTSGTIDPGAEAIVQFDTVNTPAATSEAVPVTVPVGTGRVWNQPAAVATVASSSTTIARTPSASGVQVTSGALAVTKTVSGSGAVLAPDKFLFDLACTVPTGVGSGTTAVDLGASSVVTVPKDGTTTVTGIPLGATCTVGEQGDVGEFGEQSRDPEGPQTVQITDPSTSPVPATQSVTWDNTYQFSEDLFPVRIAKVLDTDATGPFGPFSFHLACTPLLGVPTTADFSLPTADGAWEWDAPGSSIQAQSTCTVTETDADGASSTGYTGGGVTDHGDGSASFVAGTTPLVTATNTIGSGSLVVVKQRTGDGATLFGPGPFVMTATCAWTHAGTAEPITLPDDGRLVLSALNDYQVTLTGLRAGAVCQVTETDSAGAAAVTYAPSDGRVTIPGTAPSITVTVTNRFDLSPDPLRAEVLAATGPAAAGLAALAALTLATGVMLLVVRRRRT